MPAKGEFNLTIRLGNAAMNSPDDLVTALLKVADKVELGITSGLVADKNGNSVGRFNVLFAEWN